MMSFLTAYKYILAVFALALLVFAGWAMFPFPQKATQQPTPTQQPIDDLQEQTYRNEELGFEIQIPESWGKPEINLSIDSIGRATTEFRKVIREKHPRSSELITVYGTHIQLEAFPKEKWTGELQKIRSGLFQEGFSGIAGENEGYVFVYTINRERDPLSIEEARGILQTFIAMTPRQPDVSAWQTYRNEELGFEIKIPSTWKDYQASKSTDTRFLGGVLFSLPLEKQVVLGNSAPLSHANVLSIAKYTADQWEKELSLGFPDPAPFLEENGYIFAYNMGHGDWGLRGISNEQVKMDIHNMMKTFKLIVE